MSIVEASRAHALPPDDARVQVEKLVRTYQEEFGGAFHWHHNVLHFEGRGAQGRVTVDDTTVHVHIQLGLLMRPVRPLVQSKVEKHLDDHFS